MQIFIAEVSNPSKTDFERSRHSDSTIKVAFGFVGRRISIMVESNMEDRQQSDAFHRPSVAPFTGLITPATSD
jgi:hypothetical protein